MTRRKDPARRYAQPVEGFRIVDDIEMLLDAWRDLEERAAPNPWLSAGWIGPWWRAFGKGRLQIAILGSDARLRALLPLERRAGAMRSTANWHTPEFGILAEDRDAAADLAHALFRSGPRSISLYFVAEKTGHLDACRVAARAGGYATTSRVLERSPYIDTSGDWSAYEDTLARKMRNEMRRRSRKLEERDEVAFEVSDGKDGLDALLEEGFRVEAAGWKGRAGSAISASPETLRFYTEVAHWAAEVGILRLGFIRCGSRAIAFDLAIESGGVHYLLKTGIDPDFAAFGPGMLIRRAMIERAFRADVHTYDFLGRDDPWKMQWTRATHERLLFQAFRPGFAGSLDGAAWRYGRPALKTVLAKVKR